MLFRSLHTIYIIVHAIQIERIENMKLLRKHAVPITCTFGTCTVACICPVPIGHMHIILEASCIIGHMHLVGSRLFILIAYVGFCKRKGWSCTHLVGMVVVIEEDLHKMDAPLFVFRLHTIYILGHAI